ncbi:2'-5' RNA ligase family protein [Gordonia aichiensis]
MAHSVEFLFDDESERRLRSLWDALLASNLPSAGTNSSATNRPHVTIAAAQRITSAADTAIRHVDVRLPIRVTVGSPIVFGHGDRLVVALLVIPTTHLLAAHAAVVDALVGHSSVVGHSSAVGHSSVGSDEPGVFAHSLPGSWTPHVTMARRVHSEQLGDVVNTLSRPTEELPATITAIRRWDSDLRTTTIVTSHEGSSRA